MPSHSRLPPGYTFLELLATLAVAAILGSLALPAFHESMIAMRSRAALDRVIELIYYARMLAVESGESSRMTLHADADGCDRSLTIATSSAGRPMKHAMTRRLNLTGLCMTHTGDSVLVFNSRGMLRPPSRSFSVRRGRVSDRVLISIAGRVRRASERDE